MEEEEGGGAMYGVLDFGASHESWLHMVIYGADQDKDMDKRT